MDTQLGPGFEASMRAIFGCSEAVAKRAAQGHSPHRSGFDGVAAAFEALGHSPKVARRCAVGYEVSEAAARQAFAIDASIAEPRSTGLAAMQRRLAELEELLRLLPPDGEVVTESRGRVLVAEAGSARVAGGVLEVQLIQAGWSKNSRYYPAEVLRRDGPKAFPAGTKMFVDHDTDAEAEARPSGSLRNLAGIFTEAAFAPPDKKILKARAKLVGPWKESIMEMAPYIGVSIRAYANGEHGTAEGRQGWIVSEISEGRSVDFVTTPAAGGRVLSVESVGAGRVAERLAAWVASLPAGAEHEQHYRDGAADALTTIRGLGR